MNEIFLSKMQNLLKEDYTAYLKTLEEPVHRGLRVNTLKCTPSELMKWVDFECKPTQISDTVFEISNHISSLGNSIAHRMGLFYLQEVSACSAVEVLNPKPGEWVLDLCAAPGGKSTQIAMKLQNQGILFSNEIENSRAMILLSNLERCGVCNAVITNSSPSQLASVYAGKMDKILVDAPCSGEGMFKKESQALLDWSQEHVISCSVRQKKILNDALTMLKEGGILVYSTCTYSIEENEMVIDDLLTCHPELELLEIQVPFGRKGYDYGKVDGKKVLRIFPMDQGEGHFVAKLQKKSSTSESRIKSISTPSNPIVEAFLKDQIENCDYTYTIIKDKVFLSPFSIFDLGRIHVLRQGIELGELRKGRLEPHQHFYVCAAIEDKLIKKIDCSLEEVTSVIKGETLIREGYKGFYGLFYQGKCFGFTKVDGRIAKNRYPKGLRERMER